ncbi:MAG: DUF357 domain-containing protein [Candidatus Micrarchaeota archaeon]|nr:DUF357 domain-containing protein [Candidatus Micrarchaeota archaeon]
MEIEDRIKKDIGIFSDNIKKVDKSKLSAREDEVVELAKMYAKDAGSWLEKKDYYTSFSSIAYAHGLLDAILKTKG